MVSCLAVVDGLIDSTKLDEVLPMRPTKGVVAFPYVVVSEVDRRRLTETAVACDRVLGKAPECAISGGIKSGNLQFRGVDVILEGVVAG